MDAREIAEGISEGVNALERLLGILGDGERAPPDRVTADEIADGLETLERAVSALTASTTVWSSFELREEDLDRVGRLRPLVARWRETGVAEPELTRLAEAFLASFAR